MTLEKATRLSNHITHGSGKRKTVCVTACLTALGVPADKFHYTGSIASKNYLSILNRNGFSTRSRKSKMPKNASVGKCRKAIEKLDEDVYYFVILWDGKHGKSSAYCHAVVLDNKGNTVVDTDPRKRDARKVHTIHAVKRFS